MLMKRLLVALLVLYPLSALAVTYEWTDQRGTVNFTEDLGNVPKKYRKKVKILSDENPAPQTVEIPEPAAKGTAGTAKQEEPAKAKKLYGGKDENAWRAEFRDAVAYVRQTESELAELRGRMTDTSKMSRAEYLSIQNAIRNNEIRLQQQQSKLDALKETADRLGVPAEFRQ
jgi:hypothetical protein